MVCPISWATLLPLRTQAAQSRHGALAQGQVVEMTELLAAGGDLGRELAAAGQKLGQDLPRAGHERRRRRPGKGAVARDHLGIDPVGFGQTPARAGKVAHPRGVDQRDPQPALAEQAVRQPFIAARGLHDHQIRRTQVELVGERGNARRHRCPPPAAGRSPR